MTRIDPHVTGFSGHFGALCHCEEARGLSHLDRWNNKGEYSSLAMSKQFRIEEVPGEKFRYRVNSWTEPDTFHLVDVLALEGNGECSCAHFRIVCKQNWSRLSALQGRAFRPVPYGWKDNTQCRHIRDAERHAWHHLKQGLSRAEGEGGI